MKVLLYAVFKDRAAACIVAARLIYYQNKFRRPAPRNPSTRGGCFREAPYKSQGDKRVSLPSPTKKWELEDEFVPSKLNSAES